MKLLGNIQIDLVYLRNLSTDRHNYLSYRRSYRNRLDDTFHRRKTGILRSANLFYFRVYAIQPTELFVLARWHPCGYGNA